MVSTKPPTCQCFLPASRRAIRCGSNISPAIGWTWTPWPTWPTPGTSPERMITADAFIAVARARGFDFYTGVPCSFLTPLINGVLSDRALRYVGAASEGEAVAIAAGAWLAGRRTVVMCQNSGLGNAVNPLTSLNAPFRIPTLFITTWRGRPGEPDEPQHEVMGLITQDLLSLIRVEHAPFPAAAEDLAPTLALAAERMRDRDLPYAL